ncbi:aquaporin-7 isoform X2 [Mesocricetus auratus]|uniref:Aquaporin-7 isoform X2 n=1 Tax=Mesocricetus auratus TaxID=10036 RepID=A0ABM2X5Z3_MESAU|nr:aquaporin-7 isoform X2 [Mesocricetus auratus]XP_040596061.1 aquaporin-7 isoform X2 [Mesocricetus auratus]
MAEISQPRRPILRNIQSILQREMVREFLAESMSTYVMMVFGLGSVAHMVLGDQKLGSYLGVNLGFGFGVTMGVHVAGGISGAHMNAAVTFTNCALGRMPWRKFPIYVLGQFLGSFSAAATTYLIFYSAIDHFAGGDLLVTGPLSTANIFATYLPEHMTVWQGFLDEVFVTAMLQLCLFAITDKKNSPALHGTEALVIGILVCVIGVSLGMNSGYAINPSRDLPPRFFTFIAGWGKKVFRAGDNWWWVPVVAPIVGAYIGGIVYLGLIHCSIPQQPQRLENSAAGGQKITASPVVPLTRISSTPAPNQPAPLASPMVPLTRISSTPSSTQAPNQPAPIASSPMVPLTRISSTQAPNQPAPIASSPMVPLTRISSTPSSTQAPNQPAPLPSGSMTLEQF